jgi:predicted enzyme related to lactoylglutathione lyase
MACRMTELVLDARDPDRLAAFWCEVLGWEVTDASDYEVEIAPRGVDAGAPTMVFLRSQTEKVEKLRLHLDLRPTDCDHAAELERLLAAGATPADIGQGDVRWAVLADPEGNEFCLLHPVESLGPDAAAPPAP